MGVTKVWFKPRRTSFTQIWPSHETHPDNTLTWNQISLLSAALLQTFNTPIASSLHSHLPFQVTIILSIPTTTPSLLGECNSEERLGNKWMKHLSSFQLMFLFLQDQTRKSGSLKSPRDPRPWILNPDHTTIISDATETRSWWYACREQRGSAQRDGQ